MTQQELTAFAKYAVSNNDLASTLALKYNRAVQTLGQRYGISPRTVSYGPTKPYISSGKTTYDRFVNAIMQQESSGKANVINKQSGALGLYQFMPKTLTGLGYKGTREQFLNNPQLQTHYMHKLTQQNAKSLGINIKTMNPQQAMYLAAAHYGGVGGAQKIMRGNRRYGSTVFHGKSQYGYMNDIYKKMYGR